VKFMSRNNQLNIITDERFELTFSHSFLNQINDFFDKIFVYLLLQSWLYKLEGWLISFSFISLLLLNVLFEDNVP